MCASQLVLDAFVVADQHHRQLGVIIDSFTGTADDRAGSQEDDKISLSVVRNTP
jgi:hypothetical protein